MVSIAGVFVEPRMVKQVYFNIKNFFSVLPKYKLYFFCGKGKKDIHLNNFKKYKCDNYNVEIFELETNNLTSAKYSDLFKSFYIIDKVSEDYILTIQTDGCLCLKSRYKIEDFLKYDYIGGYMHIKNWWRQLNGVKVNEKFKCFNGGFSLRNKSAMIKVLNEFKPEPTRGYYKGCPINKYSEDVYFTVGMIKLGLKVGNDSFAKNFCSHTNYVRKSFCVHKLYHYSHLQYILFLKYCPEFKKFSKLKYIK